MPVHLEGDFDLLVVLDVSQWITKIILTPPFRHHKYPSPKNKNVIVMVATAEDQIHHLATTNVRRKLFPNPPSRC